jgi:WD40-like Beta Propeller Repeat
MEDRAETGSKVWRIRAPLFLWLALCSILLSPLPATSIWAEGADVLGADSSPPPQPQPFVASEVPKPSDVKDWSHPRISPDGQWLAFHFNTDATPDTFNIGVVRLDGSAFRCLTCALPIDARRPVWFPDGLRIMFHTPKGLTNVFSILELDTSELFTIKGMRSAHLLDHDRWTMVTPDGRKLAWTKVWGDGFRIVMGALIRDTAGYHVEDVRWIYPPPLQEPIDPEQWAQAFAWYENKQFIDGGRTLVFAGTRDQGANIDGYRLDLTTGRVGCAHGAVGSPLWHRQSHGTVDHGEPREGRVTMPVHTHGR